MVWACFTVERLGPLIVCIEWDIEADEYEHIIYDRLFSLVDDLLEPLEQSETFQVVDNTIFLFM